MTQPAEEPQLVGDDWKPSTFEDPGAAELSARIEAAAPLVVPRRVLDGRCGLEARELWGLGVRTVPAGALSTGGGVLLRLVMVAAIAAMGVCLGMAAAGVASLDDRDHGSLGVGGTIALVMVLVFIAHGLFRLAWSAAGRERRRRLDRRRVAPEGTLEARVLADRRLEPEDDAVETVGRFLLVADDQAFTTQRGRERIEGLQRLSRRLGVTSGQRGRRHALLREPLALLAVPGVMLSALLAVLAVVFAFTGDESALEYIAAAAVMASVAAALLGCARRWTSLPG